MPADHNSLTTAAETAGSRDSIPASPPGGPVSAMATMRKRQRAFVTLNFYHHKIETLIDTGASRTLLRRSEYLDICKRTRRQPILKPTVELCSLTGHALKVLGETQIIEKDAGPVKVIVVEGLPHAAILGMNTLGEEAVLDFRPGHKRMFWREGEYVMKPYESHNDLIIAALGTDPLVMKGTLIENVVKDYEHVFSAKGESIGCHPGVEMNIETTGGPIRQRAYRAPLTKRHVIENEIKDMLEAEIIHPSSSQWTVIQVQGKVVKVRHQQTGATKILNWNKVRLMDPDLNWDGVNTRPVRQTNISTKLTGVRVQGTGSRAVNT